MYLSASNVMVGEKAKQKKKMPNCKVGGEPYTFIGVLARVHKSYSPSIQDIRQLSFRLDNLRLIKQQNVKCPAYKKVRQSL